MKLNKNKIGLILGIIFAFIHLIWVLCVAISPSLMQKAINWILSLHFLGMIIVVEPFSILNAVLLLIIAFIFGFVIGWVFVFAWNLFNKK